MVKPKFSDELKEAVLADKASGMKTGEVADKHGLTAKQVENICTVHRNKSKRRDLTTDERREIVQLLRDDVKRADIAVKYELDPTGVDKIRNGMDTNPHYTYKTWDNITASERNCVLKRVASGELSITAVVNGWLSTNQIIQEAYNEYVKQRETVGGYWYAFLGKLREFAIGLLGAGITVTRAKTSEPDGFAVIEVKTEDDKLVEFRVEVLTYAE